MGISDETTPTEAAVIDELQQSGEMKIFAMLPIQPPKETKSDESIFTQPLRPGYGLRTPTMPSIQPSEPRPAFEQRNNGTGSVIGDVVSNVLLQADPRHFEEERFEFNRPSQQLNRNNSSSEDHSRTASSLNGRSNSGAVVLHRNSSNVLPSQIIPEQVQTNILSNPEDFTPRAKSAEEQKQLEDEEDSKESDLKDPAESQPCNSQAYEKVKKRKSTEAIDKNNDDAISLKRELPPRKCKRFRESPPSKRQ